MFAKYIRCLRMIFYYLMNNRVLADWILSHVLNAAFLNGVEIIADVPQVSAKKKCCRYLRLNF